MVDMDHIINQEFIPHAKENGLVIFFWLPYTMHETDQLDNSVFKPLKQNWQKFVPLRAGKYRIQQNFQLEKLLWLSRFCIQLRTLLPIFLNKLFQMFYTRHDNLVLGNC